MSKANLAIFISGRGSNMEAIINACATDELDAQVKLVISDNPQAAGLGIAEEKGIASLGVDPRSFSDKHAYETHVINALKPHNIDLICLAGYMRVVGSDILAAFPDKIINIHPSLLPAFKGLEPQKQAIDYGVKFSGCSVHYVNSKIDSGRIIKQAVVPVHKDDTVEGLSARILIEEHRLYPLAIQAIIHKKETV